MKRSILLLILSATALASCVYEPPTSGEQKPTDPQTQQTEDPTPTVVDDEKPEQKPEEHEEEHHEEEKPEEHEEEKPEEHEEEHHEEEKPIDTEGAGDGGHTSTIDDEDVDSTNKTYQYSLEDYTNFTWHENGPEYCENWVFYHGTSKNPNGSLWGSVDDEYCGVEFQENCYIVSPTLKSWKKTEIRFYFWYSCHQSSRYNADSAKAQFILDVYDEKENKISSQEIKIAKKDIPTNKTTGEVKLYVREPKMTHFILRFNNYIPNSQGGYSAVLCDATLKGWNYD